MRTRKASINGTVFCQLGARLAAAIFLHGLYPSLLFLARNGYGAMSETSPLPEAKQKSDLWGRNADAKRNLPQILRGQAAFEGA